MLGKEEDWSWNKIGGIEREDKRSNGGEKGMRKIMGGKGIRKRNKEKELI